MKMAAVNPDFFVEAQPSELSLFNLPPTQTAVEKIYYQQVLPISQISDSSPIQFTVTGQNGMEFINTKDSFMSIKAKIVHSDGSDIQPAEYVGPVNLLAHALFEQVDATVQGKFITPAAGYYPYKAMIQTLLKYGNDAKSSQLTSQIFYKDIPGHIDDDDAKTGANDGFRTRAELFGESRLVHMIAPIAHDLFQIERYILNQVAINLKFYRAKPEFYLMTDAISPNYKIKIEEMVLNICKVQVNPAVIYAQSQVLEKTNAKYPYIKTEVRMSAISQGQVNFNIDNVCQGIKPNRIVIAFVKAQSVAGDFNTSPWNFQGFDLTDITVSVDGIPALGNPIRVNFDKGRGIDCVETFHWMLHSKGKWLTDKGNQLEVADIADGYALYVFDLEPTFHDRGYLSLIKQGIVRITANFSKPLPNTVSCVILSEGIGYFELTQSRDVIVYQ